MASDSQLRRGASLKTYSRRVTLGIEEPPSKKRRHDETPQVKLPSPAKKVKRSSIQYFFKPLHTSSSPRSAKSTLPSSDSLEPPSSTPPSSPPSRLTSPKAYPAKPLKRPKRRLTTRLVLAPIKNMSDTSHISLYADDSDDEPPPGEGCCLGCTPDNESKRKGKQMTLDFGLEAFKECKECGMPYNSTRAEDRKLHDDFHKQVIGGAVLKKSSKLADLTVYSEVFNGVQHRILALDRRGPVDWRVHFEAALQASYDDLDGPHLDSSVLWSEIKDPQNPQSDSLVPRYKLFVYYIGNHPTGIVLVESIAEAGYYYHGYPGYSDFGEIDSDDDWRDYSCDELGIKDKDSEQRYAWKEEDEVLKVLMCVDRIWVHRNLRFKGIATKLVDIARENFKPNINISKENICFSWPTTMGVEFAEQYCKDVFRYSATFLVEYSRAEFVVEGNTLIDKAFLAACEEERKKRVTSC